MVQPLRLPGSVLLYSLVNTAPSSRTGLPT
jgi:hypothetical protein